MEREEMGDWMGLASVFRMEVSSTKRQKGAEP